MMFLKNKISRNFRKVSLVLILGVFAMTNVSAKLVFVTEENAVNTDNFIINADDSSSDFVDLEFGSALGVKMRYDILNNKFVLNRNLDIDGDIKLTDTTPTLFFNSAGNEFFRWNNSTKLQFGMNGNLVADITRISTNSASFRPKQFSTGATADSNPAFAFQQDTNTGMYLEGVNKVGLATNGVGRLIVDENGNVGIGEVNPAEKLHVAGSLRFEDTMRSGHVGEPGRWRFHDSSGYLMSFWNSGTDYDNWGMHWDTSANKIRWMGNGNLRSSVSLNDGSAYFQGEISTDDTATKYQFVDIHGCVRVSATAGTVAGGKSGVVRFDKSGDSSMSCSFPVPDDWVSGTDIDLDIFYSASNNNAGDVDFDLEYASFGLGDVINSAPFTDTIPGANYTTIAAGSQTVLAKLTEDIPAASLNANEMVNFRLRRSPGDAGDDYNGNINIHSIRISYTGKKLH